MNEKIFNNRLEIIGTTAQIEAVKKYLLGENDNTEGMTLVDFNNIIPMPNALKVESVFDAKLIQYLLFGDDDGFGTISLVEAKSRLAMIDPKEQTKAFNLAITYQENKKKYGHLTEISWRRENWRVDSNAIDAKYSAENKIEFDTFNESALFLIDTVAKRFPEVKFIYTWEYAASDYERVFLNGKLKSFKQTIDNFLSSSTIYYKNINEYYKTHSHALL